MKTTDDIYKNKNLILVNVLLMTLMATLDSSIVNVALPVMARKLSVSTESISWVVTAYLIVIAATTMIFGRIGDIKGKTRVFRFSIILFTIGSFFCGISDSFANLIIARIVQAIGAAASMGVSQGIVAQVFPVNERGRALGLTGTFVALGLMVGPPIGGFIISAMSWKYIFFINIPIGILIFILGIKYLPKKDYYTNEKFDIKGALLLSLSIISLFGSFITKENTNGFNPVIISGFVFAAISMAVFIFIERREQSPLLDLNIFRNRLYSLSIFCSFISFMALSSMTIIHPFYLQDTLKFSQQLTGMLLITSPVIVSVTAPVSGYISDRIGSEFLTLVGLVLTSIGLFLVSTLNEKSAIPALIFFVAVMALGNGIFQPPNNNLVMSLVPFNKLGIAGSVNSLVRNIGMVFGVSMSVALLYNRMSHRIGYPVFNYIQGRDDVFIYGMRFVYITAGIICSIGAMLTAYRLYRRKGRAEAAA